MPCRKIFPWFLVILEMTLIFVSSWAQSSMLEDSLSDTFIIQRFEPLTYFHNAFAGHYHIVRSITECSRYCLLNPTCEAFFMSRISSNNAQNNDPVIHRCTPLNIWTGDAYISIETGISGVLKNSSVIVSNFQEPPNVYRGILTEIRKTENGIAAIYDMSEAHEKMFSLGITFNEDLNQWPEMTPACFAQLSYQTGLSGTALKINKQSAISQKFIVEVMCLDFGDHHHADMTCHGPTGIWSYEGGHLGVGCVSIDCFRFEGTRHGRYRGFMAETENGIPCQRWDTQTPYPHIFKDEDFVEDLFNASKAENYCRDPDGEGAPWCYQMYGDRWAFCGVPICGL